MLSGCLLAPGTFTSELRLMKGGAFSFIYVGQIHMVDLAELAGGSFAQGPFTPACYDDDFTEERPCSKEEEAEQRTAWEEQEKASAEAEKQHGDNLKVLFQGVDPRDPEGAKALAARLERQRGWDKVAYAGDGVFDVEFRINGSLTHDFSFPLVEGVPLVQPFLTAITRDNGDIRVEAQGFVAMRGGNPYRSFMLNAARSAKAEGSETVADEPRLNGRFTIVTDGKILANNTDEGPSLVAGNQQLEWKVDGATTQPPTALVSLR